MRCVIDYESWRSGRENVPHLFGHWKPPNECISFGLYNLGVDGLEWDGVGAGGEESLSLLLRCVAATVKACQLSQIERLAPHRKVGSNMICDARLDPRYHGLAAPQETT